MGNFCNEPSTNQVFLQIIGPLSGVIVGAIIGLIPQFIKMLKKVKVSWKDNDLSFKGSKDDDSNKANLNYINTKFIVFNPISSTKTIKDICFYFNEVKIDKFVLDFSPDPYNSSRELGNYINLLPAMIHMCQISNFGSTYAVPVNSKVYFSYKIGNSKTKKIYIGDFDGEKFTVNNK